MTLLNARILSILVLALSACSTMAQSQEVPVHFGQFFNDPQLNPASPGADGDFELSLASKQNTGIFRGVGTSFASLAIRLKSKSNNFHVFGAHINRDVEGEFLRRNRAWATYSRHFQLSANRYMAIGLGIGSYQFSAKSNPVTGGASDTNLDTKAGIRIYSDKGSIGLSARQLTGAEVIPFDQIITLIPRYDLLLERHLDLSQEWRLSPAAFLAYSDIDTPTGGLHGGLALRMTVSELLHFGMSYEDSEGYYAFLGIHDINLSGPKSNLGNNGRLNIDLSYFIPQLDNQRTRVNAFEFIIGYKVGPRVTSSR